MSSKPRISLRSVLIGINLVVLTLPLAGIQLMRLYESALVRQTESALIAQAAFIAAFYRAVILETGTQDWLAMSREVEVGNTRWQDGAWIPQPPQLDLTTSPTLPTFPDASPAQAPQAMASAVGTRLMPVLKDAQLTTLAGIRVVDPWGVIVASTGEDVGLSIAAGEEIQRALEGQSASRIRVKTDIVEDSGLNAISRTSRIRVFVASPILLHERLVGAVMLSRTPPSIVQALEAKRWLLLQALALLVVLVLLMSLLTFRLIARPIRRLADQAGQIASGELSAAATLAAAESRKPRTLEIARLQEAITAMAQTLEQRANYLQDFSRHVSHEFKTPIAGIRAAIEVLKDHQGDMTSEQYHRFLDNISADAERLNRLTKRLTELTRAEMRTDQRKSIGLAAIVQTTAAAYPRLAVDSTAIDPSLTLLTDPDALAAALEILFDNALQHGAENITASYTDHTLQIADDGHGISANNAPLIFDAFFTTQRENGGTGLGLTIASALLNQAGAKLTLARHAQPTTFAIEFMV